MSYLSLFIGIVIGVAGMAVYSYFHANKLGASIVAEIEALSKKL
jgi:hypothetical protein